MDRSQAEHDKLRLEDVEYVDSFFFFALRFSLLVAMKTRTRTTLERMTALKTKTGVKARPHQLSAGKGRTPILS
jgi:hypothetical protein